MSYTQRPVSELATDIGHTIRMPSNSYLTVDSRDRHQSYAAALASPSSPYNFTITKGESIFNGFFTRIGVTEIQFPWYLPNINGESNTIKVYVQGTAVPDLSGVVSIPVGFYTPQELQSVFEAKVNALLSTLGPGATNVGAINVEYVGPETLLTTPPPLDASIPYSFMIDFTPSGAVYENIAFAPDPQKLAFNNLFSLMSFIPGTVGVPGVPGSTNYSAEIFTAPTDCLYTPYIDIVSRRLVAYQALYDTTTAPVSRNIICRLYLNNDNVPLPTSSTYWNGTDPVTVINEPVLIGQRPGTIYKQFRNPKLLRYIADVPVGQLDVQVYDSLGNPLDNVFNATYDRTATAQIPDFQFSMLASEN
jgi:hypothetical protein